MSNKKYDIHERIFKFIVGVIKFVERLPRTPTSQVIINQILKSVTSMGANDQEADGAATNKEFVHRYSIVRKEGKETNFWLRLIGEINPGGQKRAKELQSEGKEIVAIVSKIISNASRKSARKK
ncbi:four helix bundle protein [Patescibacteria group bacterium]|nr:four helix bundle protein [Patescibacteria group bacterium]